MSKALIFADCFHPDIKRHADSVVIALNPQARAQLLNQGIPVIDTTSFFVNESHQRASSKSLAISDFIRSNFDFEDEFGIFESYREVVAWYARFSANYCLWAIEVLNQAVACHHPREIIIYENGWVDRSGPLLGSRESYFGELAEQFGRRHEIKVRVVYLRKIQFVWESLLAFVKPIFLESMSYAAGRLLGESYRKNLKVRYAGGGVFFTASGFYMERLLSQLKNAVQSKDFLLMRHWRGWNGLMSWFQERTAKPFDGFLWIQLIGLWPRESFRRRQGESFKKLNRLISHHDLFSDQGIFFDSIVSGKISRGISRIVRSLHDSAPSLKWFFDHLVPSLVISVGNQEEDILIGELCRKGGIAGMMISHGSYSYSSDATAMREWQDHSRRLIRAPYPYVAMQTPLARGFLENFSAIGQGVVTGPLAWGTLADRSGGEVLREKWRSYSGARYVLVHAGTPKARGSLRFHIYETVDEYIASIRDLARVVENIPEACLIVRFRPFGEFSVDVMKALIPFSNKVILSTDESFPQVLGAADLLVSFSSTTIEEAFHNQVPVLLYGCQGRYYHVSGRVSPIKEANKAGVVYGVSSADELDAGLRHILKLLPISEPELFKPYCFSQEECFDLGNFLRREKELIKTN